MFAITFVLANCECNTQWYSNLGRLPTRHLTQSRELVDSIIVMTLLFSSEHYVMQDNISGMVCKIKWWCRGFYPSSLSKLMLWLYCSHQNIMSCRTIYQVWYVKLNGDAGVFTLVPWESPQVLISNFGIKERC